MLGGKLFFTALNAFTAIPTFFAVFFDEDIGKFSGEFLQQLKLLALIFFSTSLDAFAVILIF